MGRDRVSTNNGGRSPAPDTEEMNLQTKSYALGILRMPTLQDLKTVWV